MPGYIQWLLSKLASQSKLAEVEGISQSSADRSNSAFLENLLEPEEEKALMDLSNCREPVAGRNGTEVMLNLLTSRNHEWSNSDKLLSVLKAPLLRLCARYLLQEKKRGKALDSVANFHLQNGAMIERINWMADRSEKGLNQSAGIMVNYVYRLGHIEEYAQSYFSTGNIHASDDVRRYVEVFFVNEIKQCPTFCLDIPDLLSFAAVEGMRSKNRLRTITKHAVKILFPLHQPQVHGTMHIEANVI
ncbi:hypothetical protein Patl1_09923 [Pistacia atlantica]|uniref:Uncharacterized protein n=1 Tax=Pistacia atlantica TaxID=434234 RepID=A0ACC1A5Y1_9ROSI|nr:hypothetical protein Patl1_09923 [Pistacia atlantica]